MQQVADVVQNKTATITRLGRVWREKHLPKLNEVFSHSPAALARGVRPGMGQTLSALVVAGPSLALRANMKTAPHYLSAGRTVTGTSRVAVFLPILSVAVRRMANLPGRVNGTGYLML